MSKLLDVAIGYSPWAIAIALFFVPEPMVEWAFVACVSAFALVTFLLGLQEAMYERSYQRLFDQRD